MFFSFFNKKCLKIVKIAIHKFQTFHPKHSKKLFGSDLKPKTQRCPVTSDVKHKTVIVKQQILTYLRSWNLWMFEIYVLIKDLDGSSIKIVSFLSALVNCNVRCKCLLDVLIFDRKYSCSTSRLSIYSQQFHSRNIVTVSTGENLCLLKGIIIFRATTQNLVSGE